VEPVPPNDDAPSRHGPLPSGPSFGAELRRERELRGIPLREIAEATKVNLRFLEALERDDFSGLPGGLFTRGFIRAYAHHIGADADRLVNAYLYQVNQEQERQAAPRRPTAPRLESRLERRLESRETASTPPARRWPWVAVLALAIALLGGAAVAWLRPDWRAWALGRISNRHAVVPAAASQPPPVPAAPAAEPIAGAEQLLQIAAGDLVRVYATCGGVLLLDRTLNPGEQAEVRCSATLRLDATSGGDIRLKLDGVDLGIPGDRGVPLQGWQPPSPASPS
jgi:transcriptional regulator with XRE-family HTH domain